VKIGIWKPQHETMSVKIYTDNIVLYLQKHEHEIFFFGKNDSIPDVDIIWDPTCTGARYPNKKILQTKIPWIVTLHGAANLSMPLKYTFGNTIIKQLNGFFINTKRRFMWMFYKHKVAHIITVSNFAKQELITELGLKANQISVIYHGYDDTIFFPQSGSKSYLLHVSNYQPIKNIERIIEAYQQIKKDDKLPLVLICPGFPSASKDEKVKIINTIVDSKQIAKYMKESYAFIFPSFRESFGMPLLEAMASGVPVITSNNSACNEITKDASVLVNPQNTIEIKEAIELILNDKKLHCQLSKNAIENSKLFSWEKTARFHEMLFERHVLN
jgi:glycosyltransferase involved in cell wall biosynthesis